MPRFTLKDIAGAIGILIGLSGLVWNAAQQAAKNDEQGTHLERIDTRIDGFETKQAGDHDRIVKMESRP